MLCSRNGGSRLIENCCRASHFRYSKNHQWRIRPWLNTAVCIVDVDIRIAELGGGARQLARPAWKFDLSNFSLCVANSFPIQDCLGCCRVVDDDAHKDRFPGRDRLKSHDVYTAVRERPADFS